jgi:hypothetical protein
VYHRALKHLNKRKLAVFALALSSLILCGWYWNKGTQARLWTEIQAKRYRALQFRFIPALSSFLERNLSPNPHVTTTYGTPGVDHNGNNLAYSRGSILSFGDYVGDFWLTFTYRGTAIDPSSMEMRARLSPGFLGKLDQGELRHLVKRTRKEGEVSDTFCGQQWFSYFAENGVLNVTLRAAFPNSWIEDIPEYEPGLTEEMYNRISPMAIRYLKEEAFSETEDLRVELVAPDYRSPTLDTSSEQVAAYYFPKEGPPVSISIQTTASGRKGLRIELKGEGAKGKGSAAFLKPEFLKLGGKTVENTPRVDSTEAGRQIWVYVFGDLSDFGKWSNR